MIAEFSVVPIGASEDVAEHIATAVKMVDDSGFDYQLTSMGTIVEGPSRDVFKLICGIHETLIEKVPRLEINIRLDDHRGRNNMIAKRVQEIEKLTGQQFLSEAY